MKTLLKICLILIAFDCYAETAALEHAKKQVKQMLRDRPKMAYFLTKDNKKVVIDENAMPYKYALQFYSKRVNTEFIFWSSEDPKKPAGYRADHIIPRHGKPGKIRLRKTFKINGRNRDLAADQLWGSFIYETINIKNAKYFIKYYKDAVNGKLNRNEYVTLNQKLEYSALVKRKEMFVRDWLPWARKNKIRLNAALYGINVPSSFEDWIRGCLYTYWENYYDNVLFPYLEKVKKYQKSKRR